MKIIKQTSPYIYKKVSVQRMMTDVLIALIPLVIFSIVMNGFNALYVILLSVATMMLSEIVFVYLTSKEPYDGSKKTFKYNIRKTFEKISINNYLTPMISGIIYALLLPAGTSPYVVIVGALIGIVFGKLVFGGLGCNIFNPAALGRVSVMVAFGSKLTYGNGNFFDVVAGGTPLQQVTDNIANIYNYSLSDLFLGFVPGSMGEVCKVLILISGLYLFIRFSADFRTFLATFVSFVIITFVIGISISSSNEFSMNDFSIIDFMLYHTFSGGLLFGAVFMVTDPVTTPITKPGRVLFGVLVACISLIIRFIGAYPEGVAFAILICNMLVPLIDSKVNNRFKLNHIIIYASLIAITSLVIVLAI